MPGTPPVASGSRARPRGVGLGVRYAFLDELEARVSAGLAGLDFVEVCPENYMRRGGDVPRALFGIAEKLPVLTHGLTMALGDLEPPAPDYLSNLRRFLDRIGARSHSDHLCFGAAHGRHAHDLLPLPFTEEAVRHAAARTRRAAEDLGRPMVLENVTYYLHPGRAELSEGEFVSAVVREAGAELLLDVNNVWVNAQNFGLDPRELLTSMPLDRVAQIHVAGHTHVGWAARIIDTHGAPIAEPVLELLRYALERTGPVPIVLERDTNVPTLDDLLAEVRVVRAIAEEVERRAPSLPAASPARGRVPEVGRPGRLEVVMEALLRTIEVPATRVEAALRADQLAPEDRAAFAALDPTTVGLYRRLVRGGLEDAVRAQLPLAAGFRGAPFAADVERWVDREGLPRSAYLRDAARAFVTALEPEWRADSLDWLAELARFEVLGFEVAAALEEPSPFVEALDVARPVVLGGAPAVDSYGFAVHEAEAGSPPRRAPTRLLRYRDAEGVVRTLLLSEVADLLLRELLAGEPLGGALARACTAAGASLGPQTLAETSAFLADLASRGVLLGAAVPSEAARMRPA
jgi:uncharacterized protein